ncbi:DUF317 domain-containing protein [Streptomyces sp. NPDC004111]|uniref:DUF317 domain-containing protein n=1 Tax=Streptomyces sp. NPDC004111 TaxID=3364690 RepID=UPI0036C16BEB
MTVGERQLAAYDSDHSFLILDDVQPRVLAGPGDARHVTHVLLAAGWSLRSDPAAPSVHLVSPDLRWELHCNAHRDSAWWRLTGSPPDGGHVYASFGRQTPVEILAGLTDALWAAPAKAPVPDAWSVLEEAGWEVREEGEAARATSPDQLVRWECEVAYVDVPDTFTWRIEVAGEHGPPVWRGYLNGTLPPHLMSGLARALADPQPLQRHAWGESMGHYTARQEPSTVSGRQVALAHRTRVKAAAARRRAARRTGLTTTPGTPAPPRTAAPSGANTR